MKFRSESWYALVMKAQALPEKDLPPAPPLRRLIGPSFIILGLGLGSGEVILWPYLASNYGLGLVWGMLLGITMQYFINMEVVRYALVRGESIFVGFARLGRWLPLWFILTTFFGFGWPGIGVAGATLLGNILGWSDIRLLAIGILLAAGAILTIGAVVYQTVETLQKWLIGIGVPLIVLLTLYLVSASDIIDLGRGLIGQGRGFRFLPEGLSLATFLGALAFAGAGGNLNLAQSFYVRDKGYGMGKYAERITSVLTGKQSARPVRLTGTTFPMNAGNLRRFHKWWQAVNLEHALIFWGLGLLTMLTLSLLAYITAYGNPDNKEGIAFVLNEAAMIGTRTLPFIGVLFLIVTGVMLSATQLTVLDSTSRIMAENVLLLGHQKKQNISRTYYAILWLQILFGIAVIGAGFTQPRELITLSAVINAFTMFSYTGILFYVSNRMLPREVRPNWIRNLALIASFCFLGYFCAMTVLAFN